MGECIFCGIAEKRIPADIVVQTDEFVAFRDINPQAPTHILVIPRKHISTLNDLSEQDGPLVGRMVLAAKGIAKSEGIEESGWRSVFNTMAGAGQSVFHIHLHILGGRPMKWPPG